MVPSETEGAVKACTQYPPPEYPETGLCLLAFQGYLVHHVTHLLCCHLGIDLCGGNVLVSRTGLYDSHVRAHFYVQASE